MEVACRLDSLAEQYALPAGAADQLAVLLGLVAASPHGLTAVREPEKAVEVHVADSLAGLQIPAVAAADAIADLGSGAGFPGLVLAAALPETAVTLVESVAKKAAFLREAVAELGLSNAAVVADRAEAWDLGRGSQAVVTARALAPLTALVEYAAPLLRVGGSLVAWKGPGATEEETDGAAAALRLGMSPPEAVPVAEGAVTGVGERYLYVSLKLSTTPSGFPRRAGMARKRPIQA